MAALADPAPDSGVIAAACDALNVARASFYRRRARQIQGAAIRCRHSDQGQNRHVPSA